MADSARTYLRYPHIHDDRIVFTAANDIWLAPAKGGRAYRLTSDHAPVVRPRFSPDGAKIAFVTHMHGAPEVEVINADGSGRKRLTYFGQGNTVMLGWRGEDQILVASSAGEFNRRTQVIKSVGLDGRIRRLEIGSASGYARHDSGAQVLASLGIGNAPSQWKRYRGGTAPRLWFDARGDGDWQRLLPEEEASLVDPLFVGDALVFTSDRAARFPDRAHEQANLWLWQNPGSGSPTQLTFQGEDAGYVRDAATDGKQIVWHSRGRIYLLESLTGTSRQLEFSLPGIDPAPLEIETAESIGTFSPDDSATGCAIEVRGKTFWLPYRQGPARAVAGDARVRTRMPVIAGSAVAVVTDSEGDDAIEFIPVRTGAQVGGANEADDGDRRLLGAGRLGRVLSLSASPNGAYLATVSHDGDIRLIRTADGLIRTVGHSSWGEAGRVRFSPDSAYLTWSQPAASREEFGQVFLARCDGEEPGEAVTSGRYNDSDPVFTLDGRYLAFLSDRTFDPNYNPHSFDLSFSGVTRPYLLPLKEETALPFGPSVAGWSFAGTADQADTTSAVTTDELERGHHLDRIAPLPVPAGIYRGLEAVSSGLVWLSQDASTTGTLGSTFAGSDATAPKPKVTRWDFAARKSLSLVDAADSFVPTKSGKYLVVRCDQDLTLVSAERKAEAEDAKVTIDLSRIRIRIDRRAEWLQMFDENTRLMRDHYWREDMDGVDWQAVTDRWRNVVPRAATYDDFTDLLWETQGELNTSHAYVVPPSSHAPTSENLGLLGADFHGTDAREITRIVPAESSNPKARSPLLAAGVAARVGDRIVAVGGRETDAITGAAPLLVGCADKPVELTLERDGHTRQVAVVPLADESELRYQDWVRSRREYVRDHSGGRLGYLHVPDMGPVGWAQLHRDLRSASTNEGIIADIRFNGGGHTSALVAEKLMATVVAWVTVRQHDTATANPVDAARGPVILVCNEFAGSDGDIINARAQELGIGPVVGMRTWGGVIGIDNRYRLVDGTTVTQPRYAYQFKSAGWSIENHGVDPDIVCEHTPADLFTDRDKQLDRAIAEALERLEQVPAATPPSLAPPRVRD